MSKTKDINKKEQRGNELFCEATATLLEDLDNIALDISPEEADEFQEIFNKISEFKKKNTCKHTSFNDGCNSIAAEENEIYK